MYAISYQEAQTHFPQTLLRTAVEPVLITQSDGNDCVLMSLSEYQSLKETVYLLSSPKNATRLLDSVNELNRSGGTERALFE